jgi:catechol 2,3-dioxygenase-like lactoylglutathione lyase family enzyme
MPEPVAMPSGIHLSVRDMPAALAFYRMLGIDIPAAADAEINVDINLGGGFGIAFGTHALTRAYDAGWSEPSGPSRLSIEFKLPTRESVDALYAKLTAAGYHGHLAPFDAFWGARYASVDDPDGNTAGFQSPQDDAHRRPPPASAFEN